MLNIVSAWLFFIFKNLHPLAFLTTEQLDLAYNKTSMKGAEND